MVSSAYRVYVCCSILSGCCQQQLSMMLGQDARSSMADVHAAYSAYSV
jgi:hypothetical protein